MTADVMVCSYLVILVADNDDAFIGYLKQQIIPGVGDRTNVVYQMPIIREKHTEVFLKLSI